MQRRGKIFLIIASATVIFGLCLFCSVRISRQGILTMYPAKLLEVDFLNVGQGDAELIKTPYGQNILIDGGPDNKVLAELGRNLPWLDRRIDLVINTHPHDDHVAGLIDVLKKYKVERILMTAVQTNFLITSTPQNHPPQNHPYPLLGKEGFPWKGGGLSGEGRAAPPFQEFLKVVAAKRIPVIIVAGKQQITLGPDLILEILYPGKNDLGADLNEDSIVTRLVYKDEAFLFTGDAGGKTETELLAKKADIKADVLKVGHHGSETSSSLDFLRAVAPQFAIIECGVDNQFDFPKPDTLWRLAKAGAKIFRTDLNGTVRIRTNGEKLEVIRKK